MQVVNILCIIRFERDWAMSKRHFVDVTNRDGVQTSRLGLAKYLT